MSEYTITSATDALADATFASLGIVSHDMEKSSQALDIVMLRQIPSSWTNNPILSYAAQVTIKRDTIPIFVGTCITDPRTAVAASHSISYKIVGPWYWLDETEYCQMHKRWNGTALADVRLSKVILNQSTTGTRLNSGEQIEDVIDYCIAQGCPIAKGTIAPAVQIPWEQAGPIKSSEVIRRMLKWSPECTAWWDYTPASGHPVLHVTARDAMPTTSVDLSAYRSTQSGIRPRYDLQRPGVEIIYERTTTIGDQTYLSTETDTAGDHTNKSALRATIDLAGSIGGSAQYEKVKTSDFPTAGDPVDFDWINKAWWKARVPALAAYANADLWIHDPIIEVEKDEDGDPLYPISQLPRILEEGQITPWMATGGIKAAKVTISVSVNSIERNPANGIVKKVANRIQTLTVVGTNATTRTYSRIELGSYIETVPTGIAAALYASLSILQYDGSITYIGADPDLSYRPGQKFNILNGRPEWATMDAIIQRVALSTADGSTTITFGPARHLSPDDMVALLKRIRTRNLVTGHISRRTGLAGDNGAIGGGLAPRNEAAAEGGEPKRTVHRRYPATGTYAAQIDIDEAAIIKTDETEPTDIDIKPRETLVAEINEAGEIEYRTRQMLVSEPYGDPVDDDEGGGGGGGDDEDDGPCDQNTHPGDSDFGGGDDGDYDDSHPGDGDFDEDDDYSGTHPGDNDCYTTHDYT